MRTLSAGYGAFVRELNIPSIPVQLTQTELEELNKNGVQFGSENQGGASDSKPKPTPTDDNTPKTQNEGSAAKGQKTQGSVLVVNSDGSSSVFIPQNSAIIGYNFAQFPSKSQAILNAVKTVIEVQNAISSITGNTSPAGSATMTEVSNQNASRNVNIKIDPIPAG
jgi:hypothetical protein